MILICFVKLVMVMQPAITDARDKNEEKSDFETLEAKNGHATALLAAGGSGARWPSAASRASMTNNLRLPVFCTTGPSTLRVPPRRHNLNGSPKETGDKVIYSAHESEQASTSRMREAETYRRCLPMTTVVRFNLLRR